MTAPRHFHQAVAAAKAGIKPAVSARSTAEIVADLRECWPHVVHCTQAADRLAELDAEVESVTRSLGVRADRLDKIDALLPDCPTCGGTGKYDNPDGATLDEYDCEDCLCSGKVSVAQLAATWRPVWDDANPIWRLGEFARDIRDDLRAAR